MFSAESVFGAESKLLNTEAGSLQKEDSGKEAKRGETGKVSGLTGYRFSILSALL